MHIGIKLDRRDLLYGSIGVASWIGAKRALAAPSSITPEQFGAIGDGVTNDTLAFARMAAFVNGHRGGEILLRKTTYVVGMQTKAAPAREGYSFSPEPIMEFRGCAQPLVIRGNGARLRCAAGLRYGTFDTATGKVTSHPMPYYAGGELASPYSAMIRVEDCSGPVDISDLELDGNLANLSIGGPFGDSGWQIPATGIQLVNNSATERLVRIHAHNHPLDGITIDGFDHPRASRSSIESLLVHHNGRQGCSVTGGHGYDFRNCRFSDTGRSAVFSAPGAGVDLEAEAGKNVSDLTFQHCVFSNNAGCGLLADGGPVEGASFANCTFVGTTSWAAWPKKPGFRFVQCTFVGAIAHAYGDADAARACRFLDCSFLDDPKLSPTGRVYGGGNPSRPIADLPGNPNVLFEHCNFDLKHDCVLPWTTNVVIFANCVMNQRAPAISYPRGTFLGRNVINGNANLYSAKILGKLILNGRLVLPEG